MCGLVGHLRSRGGDSCPSADEVMLRMADSIGHRGPDDAGYWVDTENGVALGHRRLAIVDTSTAGHQPMQSVDGRYVLVFNGEIYNHLEIRTKIHSAVGNWRWRGGSDTETILAAFQVFGVERTLPLTEGMFALAAWDRETQQLILARDRIGEKPLYFGWQGKGIKRTFVFASELRAFRVHPEFEGGVDRNAICLQLRHGCIPAPYTIYENIKKLLPGTALCVSANKSECRSWKYWEMSDMTSVGPFQGDDEEAIHGMDQLLRGVVAKQMMADVPLGAFLSGGLDSSTIAALMQSQSKAPIKTFTVGFNETAYNEAHQAKEIARFLGTDHTEIYVTPADALNVIPRLPDIYDEPFSDASQIPTVLISQIAKRAVSVALSGDGGDEVFCGYNRYATAARYWRAIDLMPVALRERVSSMLLSISPERWDSLSSLFHIPGRGQITPNLGDKLHKGAMALASPSLDALYRRLVSHWNDPNVAVKNAHEYGSDVVYQVDALEESNDVRRMMLFDMLEYLPDDVLVKLDRASMAVGLETRAPFLHHEVLRFSWGLPLSMKIRNGQTKWILRQVLSKYLPSSFTHGPKRGFGVPVAAWLRGPLREWAESLLDESRLNQEGYFHSQIVREKWSEHLSGKRNWAEDLWDVLMFQAWLERYHP